MGSSWYLTVIDQDYRYAGRMVLYFLNKCESIINVEKSTIEVGTDIDEMLAGIFSEELELA